MSLAPDPDLRSNSIWAQLDVTQMKEVTNALRLQ